MNLLVLLSAVMSLTVTLYTPGSPPVVRQFPICTDPGGQVEPAVSGNIVVWEHWRELPGKWNWDIDIYGYDLSQRRTFPICTADADQRLPAISGHIVVWQDRRNHPDESDGEDIYAYDLQTTREFPVCTAPRHQGWPAVSGDIIVWADARNYDRTGSDIYGYNLSTGREFAVCAAPGDQLRASDLGQDRGLARPPQRQVLRRRPVGSRHLRTRSV